MFGLKTERLDMKKEQKLPKGALTLQDAGCSAFVQFSASESGEEIPKMDMTVYSGGLIKDHWYWDDLAIDLSGMKANGSKYPVLEDHDTGRKIGFSGKPVIQDGKLKLNPENVVFVDTPYGKEFVTLAKQGFPFQSSLRGKPLRVERVEEGAETEVNGFKLKGPGSVWREWEYMEGSVCVFGWDNKTSASVFSKEEVDIDFEEFSTKKEVLKVMDITMLSTEHPDLVKQIEDAAIAKAKAEFSKNEEKFSATITDLTTKLSDSDKKIIELEKKDAMRAEREMSMKAESIWAAKLSASNLPERLFAKVRKNVSHSDFVKDGVFDETEFSKAVDAEVADWESLNIPQSVQGSGFAQKDVDTSKGSLSKEDDDVANDLFKLAGGKSA